MRRKYQGKIRIWQCLKYRTPLAKKRELVWTGEMVGVNGQIEDWGNARQRAYVANMAQYWTRFTGWPLEDLGRHEKYDDPERA